MSKAKRMNITRQTVFDLESQYKKTWRGQPDEYWLARLMQEVGELASALVGDHDDSPEWKLAQIAAICLNWLDKREQEKPPKFSEFFEPADGEGYDTAPYQDTWEQVGDVVAIDHSHGDCEICGEYFSESHYHCPRCHAVTGMYGHDCEERAVEDE